jgi:ribonuclease HI
VLRQREHVREMCGGEPGETSNNRMELTAPIMALEALTRPVVVHLYTDSTYVRSGITKWVLGWERNGWKTAAKQPVKNVDLWKRLQAACAQHEVEWFWVKGHSGVADNELADVLATRGMQEAIDGSG